MKKYLIIALLLFINGLAVAQNPKVSKQAKDLSDQVITKVIEWRHKIHQNPELSNREFNTSKMIVAHLESLGIEVKKDVAITGVVGIIKGDKPGPVIALRADMDALPVTERVDLPWASKVKSTYNNIETGVMHACGHDTHVAILMGVAEVLSKMKKNLKGTVKLFFQPAEEGPPTGEEGGAFLMIKEGVMENPKVDVVFGLHISANINVGQVEYKSGGTMAAADKWEMKVKGKPSHGSTPWTSKDPIVASSQIVSAMQTIISRNADLTNEAAVLSVGLIRGGIRNNIIPEEVEMIGTIRTLDVEMQDKLHADFQNLTTNMGKAMGVEVELNITKVTPVTYNDPTLTNKSVPWLNNAIGSKNVNTRKALTGAEDFSFFAQKVPSFFFFIGGVPEGMDPKDAAPHHTPNFYVDDKGMITGMYAMLHLTLGYMENPMK